ncbi:hypothetical protein T07_1696 [Trichinella nelsoni]|uniref:Uncharacterized protein n=1 Tax=Trichinella nelsoni TaxID=6336 RepID=A0A0V0RLL4_9BILA|nr:hypothetical protein T07_1696 [Trichinella nelsoni]
MECGAHYHLFPLSPRVNVYYKCYEMKFTIHFKLLGSCILRANYRFLYYKNEFQVQMLLESETFPGVMG